MCFPSTGKSAYHICKNDKDWAPSLHLGHDKLKSERSEDAQERDKRAGNRKRKREEAEHKRRENEIADVVGDASNDDWDNGIKKYRLSKLVML